jgi:hypothetical protein
MQPAATLLSNWLLALLAAFLALLAEPGCIVGHADQIGEARNSAHPGNGR